MFCGLPITVAAEPAFDAPASAIRKGRGSRPRRARPAISIGVMANTTTSLARIADSTPATSDRQPQDRDRRGLRRRDPRRAPVVEAAGGVLGREHHQPEQHDQGREIDRLQRLLAVDRAAGIEHHGAEDRDAGAVDAQARPAAERHAEVDGEKDGEDERHGAPGSRRAGRVRRAPARTRAPCGSATPRRRPRRPPPRPAWSSLRARRRSRTRPGCWSRAA